MDRKSYESDARHTIGDLAAMGDAAADRFHQLQPELASAAVEALAWC